MRYFFVILLISIVFIQLKQVDLQFKEPNDLRLRVIANSDSEDDQILKKQIVDELLGLYEKLGNNTVLMTKDNQNLMRVAINSITNYQVDFDINIGLNEFPAKTINGKFYESGNYNSIVVTLGEGKGNNYWCILYPDSVKNGEEIDYKLYFGEKIKGIFNA